VPVELVPWDARRTGDVGFFAGEDALEKTIEAAERWGDVQVRAILGAHSLPVPSHAFLLYSVSQVYESLEGGPELRDASVYEQRASAGRAFLLRPPGSDGAKAAAVDLAWERYRNRHYGFLQTGLGFLPVLIGRRLFHRDLPNPFPWGIICSELVLRYLLGLRSILSRLGETQAALDLGWALSLDPQTADPALLAACALRGLPPSF
jgi:hypothetical protein